MLKDQDNKKAHEDSAQVACEAAGSIRTVASLTREDDCLRVYSESLEEPMRKSNRSALWSSMLYGFSQALSFFVIALVFWYGSRLVSRLEVSLFHFFVGLMVSSCSSSIQCSNADGNISEHDIQRHSIWEFVLFRSRCIFSKRRWLGYNQAPRHGSRH